MWFLADPGEARGCSTHSFVINQFTYWWFVKIYLRRSHSPIVGNGACSHKIDYSTIYKKIVKGIKIALLVQELWRYCLMGEFFLLAELHEEGSAPAACKAGFFCIKASIYIGQQIQCLRYAEFFLNRQKSNFLKIDSVNKRTNKYFCVLNALHKNSQHEWHISWT